MCGQFSSLEGWGGGSIINPYIFKKVVSDSPLSYFCCMIVPLPLVGVYKNVSFVPAWRWMTVILLLSFVIILRRALIKLNRE